MPSKPIHCYVPPEGTKPPRLVEKELETNIYPFQAHERTVCDLSLCVSQHYSWYCIQEIDSLHLDVRAPKDVGGEIVWENQTFVVRGWKEQVSQSISHPISASDMLPQEEDFERVKQLLKIAVSGETLEKDGKTIQKVGGVFTSTRDTWESMTLQQRLDKFANFNVHVVKQPGRKNVLSEIHSWDDPDPFWSYMDMGMQRQVLGMFSDCCLFDIL
jgi:hypothetical protein